MKLRQGLLTELEDVFIAAEAMVGRGSPEFFDEELERLTKLRKEVFGLLKKPCDATGSGGHDG